MDDKGKRLLASASALAISAGLLAAPAPATPVALPGEQQAQSGGPFRSSDLIVELALRLGGQGTAEVVSRELRAMLTPLTPDLIMQLPALVRDLRGLGLSVGAQEAAEATLMELVIDADPPLSELQLDDLAGAFASEPLRIRLAGSPGTDPAAARAFDQSRDRVRARGIGHYTG